MTKFRFRSSVSVIKHGLRVSSQDEVKNEPMFFSASVQYAMEHGGPITRDFLYMTRLAFANGEWPDGAIFDSRTHMLMPGWYPCIPGWHHDDVPRSRSDGQPNYSNPEYHSQHLFALVNGDICPTEFAIGECEITEPELGRIIYRDWHQSVETLCGAGVLSRFSAPTNALIYFNWQSFHRGTKAIGNGFRWFGRLSWDTHRKHANEIRRQTQVYLEYPNDGW